jgi:hypothetical protein
MLIGVGILVTQRGVKIAKSAAYDSLIDSNKE